MSSQMTNSKYRLLSKFSFLLFLLSFSIFFENSKQTDQQSYPAEPYVPDQSHPADNGKKQNGLIVVNVEQHINQSVHQNGDNNVAKQDANNLMKLPIQLIDLLNPGSGLVNSNKPISGAYPKPQTDDDGNEQAPPVYPQSPPKPQSQHTLHQIHIRPELNLANLKPFINSFRPLSSHKPFENLNSLFRKTTKKPEYDLNDQDLNDGGKVKTGNDGDNQDNSNHLNPM